MVICPVALAVGCKKCPVFSICPATQLLGDIKPVERSAEKAAQAPASKARRSRRPRRK